MKKTLLLLLGSLCMLLAQPSIVKDPQRGILWEDTPHNQSEKLNYQRAQNYCQELILGEFKEWRLPTLMELLSIVDYSKYQPAILKEFQYVTDDALYWSSTPYVRSQDERWGVNFKDGSTSNASINYDRYVRCVHDLKK